MITDITNMWTKTNKKTQTIDNITYREIDMGIQLWYILNAGKIIHTRRQTEMNKNYFH